MSRRRCLPAGRMQVCCGHDSLAVGCRTGFFRKRFVTAEPLKALEAPGTPLFSRARPERVRFFELSVGGAEAMQTLGIPAACGLALICQRAMGFVWHGVASCEELGRRAQGAQWPGLHRAGPETRRSRISKTGFVFSAARGRGHERNATAVFAVRGRKPHLRPQPTGSKIVWNWLCFVTRRTPHKSCRITAQNRPEFSHLPDRLTTAALISENPRPLAAPLP